MSNPIFPVVSIGGSSKQNLLEDLSNALIAIRSAKERLAETKPHGRDYQGQQERLRAANEQFATHMGYLIMIETSLEAQMEGIFAQG